MIPSPRGMRGRESGLPLDTRNSLGTSGKDQSGIHGIWRHLLADWDQVILEILWNILTFQPRYWNLEPFCITLEELTLSVV